MVELPFALVGGEAAERRPVHGVDEAFDLVQPPGGDLAEVRPLGEPPAQDAVAVLDAALLVGGVGPRVEDLGLEGAVEGVLVEELASVVGDDAADPSDAPGGNPVPSVLLLVYRIRRSAQCRRKAQTRGTPVVLQGRS